jgi:hypothetical protein
VPMDSIVYSVICDAKTDGLTLSQTCLLSTGSRSTSSKRNRRSLVMWPVVRWRWDGSRKGLKTAVAVSNFADVIEWPALLLTGHYAYYFDVDRL